MDFPGLMLTTFVGERRVDFEGDLNSDTPGFIFFVLAVSSPSRHLFLVFVSAAGVLGLCKPGRLTSWAPFTC